MRPSLPTSAHRTACSAQVVSLRRRAAESILKRPLEAGWRHSRPRDSSLRGVIVERARRMPPLRVHLRCASARTAEASTARSEKPDRRWSLPSRQAQPNDSALSTIAASPTFRVLPPVTFRSHPLRQRCCNPGAAEGPGRRAARFFACSRAARKPCAPPAAKLQAEDSRWCANRAVIAQPACRQAGFGAQER